MTDAIKKSKTVTGPIAVWDITIPLDKIDIKGLICLMKDNCKKYCVQIEEGDETGYKHYQCRVSLMTKLRLTGFRKTDLGILGHLTPTSKPCASGDKFYNYCSKDKTRIDGPWTDKDIVKVITRQLTLFETFELRPYQKIGS